MSNENMVLTELINKIWVRQCEADYYFPQKVDKDKWVEQHYKYNIEKLNIILADIEYLILRFSKKN